MPAAFDLARALRRLKPEKRARITRRRDAELPFVDTAAPIGPALLLDACVYIHVLKGRTPDAAERLLGTRSLYHSAVAIAELTWRFGARLPRREAEKAAMDQLAGALREIPGHKTVAPNAAEWGEAGILAGLRARIGGTAAEPSGLNDALILLSAARIGAAVLTANVADFDILQQFVPSGRILLYKERQTPS